MPEQQKTKNPTLRRRKHPRRSTIADMAEFLARHVVDLGNDEDCRAGLTVAGFRPAAIATHLAKAQDLARAARAAEHDIWHALRCR